MSGAVAVLGRIQEIQTTIQQISPAARAAAASTAARASTVSAAGVAGAAGTASTGSSASSSSSSPTDFDAALAELTSTIDPTLLSRLGAASAPAAPAPSAPATTGPTGADLVAEARTYLGVPYVWGGESPDGLDCSGLVQLTLGALGVAMPRVARDQMHEGTPVASMAEARVGDLLVFDGGSHIGIYLGEGRMIDAPKPGRVVSERDVYETPTAIRRVLPGANDALVASSAAQRSSLSLLIGGTA